MNNQWFSKVAVWMVIALVLFTVFKQFDRGAVRDPFGNAVGFIRNLHFAPRLVTADASDVSNRAIVKEIVVPLDRAKVWSLWASAEGLTRWLVNHARVELRPGGAYEIRPVGVLNPGSVTT